ncbi:unnamed protein product, partial [marine sediment metagenome]
KWNLAVGVAVFLVVFVLISACAETVEKKPEKSYKFVNYHLNFLVKG